MDDRFVSGGFWRCLVVCSRPWPRFFSLPARRDRRSPPPPPAKGAAGPAASAPIQKGLLRDLASGKADQFVVEFSAKADLARRGEGQGPHRARQVRPRHADGERPEVAGRPPRRSRTSRGIKAKSYWLYNEMIVQGIREAGPGVREPEGRHRGPRREDLPARQAGPVRRSSSRPPAATPSGASRRSARPRPGPRASWARASSSPASTPASTSPTPRSSTSTAATTATARSPTTTTGGTRQASAAASRATTSATAPTRWARWSAATAPARSRPTSASRPAPRWIAAKGCEDLGCSEESLLSSGQWILAPTDLDGDNPDPSKRPDIVNNSWGGGPDDTFYLATVQAWRAAGIIPVFSSGNPGPFCGEGGSPGRLQRGLQRRRDRHRRQHRRLLRPRPVRLRQGQPRRRRPGRRRHLERPGRRLRGLLRHVDGDAPRRGHDRPDALGASPRSSATRTTTGR